jgi:hypothetical protein
MAFAETVHSTTQEGIFLMRSSHSLDGVEVTFDDDHAVAAAGLLLTGTLTQHLGLEAIIDGCVDLAGRPGSFRPGRKALTLIHSLVAGGDFIDDADVLRSGSTATVLGHQVMAPSTLGTFLRSFTFGNVRQLDRCSELALTAAWAAGAGPGDTELVIDIDSSICEVYGYDKAGAAYGYTHKLGYHPMLATRAATGEVLHCRFRKGSAKPPAAPSGSSARPWAEPGGPAPPAESCCEPTPATGRPRSSGPAPTTGRTTPSPSAKPGPSWPPKP